MLRLLWLSHILVIASSRSVVEHISDGEVVFHRLFVSEHKLTQDELNSYLKAMERHPDYVPKEVQRIFQQLAPRTTSDLLAFVNEVREGYVDLSADSHRIVSLIETRMPQLCENVNAALSMLLSTIRKMRPTSKASFHKYWIMFLESMSAPATLRSVFLAAFFSELLHSYATADASVQKEIYELSPETDQLLQSEFAKTFVKAAKEFASGDSKRKFLLGEQDVF
ncbi:ShKT domain-containing protein [Trichostrongylus colubriformis]|uniref:ShKT domain-containing protein n=1 Tax=Trichostrongylus colubriformis TaxID=6319 RepID=A0AAN8ETB8_TRICO